MSHAFQSYIFEHPDGMAKVSFSINAGQKGFETEVIIPTLESASDNDRVLMEETRHFYGATVEDVIAAVRETLAEVWHVDEDMLTPSCP